MGRVVTGTGWTRWYRALPDGFQIVAWFCDAPLRTAVAALTCGTERSGVNARPEGGLAELLEAARRLDAPFVAVICESIERISCSSHLAARVDCELDRAGVTLLAADEGISPGASALVNTRHLRQAVAEWYLMPMLQRLSAQDAHTDPQVQDVSRDVAERIDRAEGRR
jgi:hypothetical protein